MNVLWSIEPFRSYRNYINVYSVEIISGDSGITCDPEVREKKNTPLGANFGGGCTNPNARGITVNQNVAREGLSPQPWEERKPGYGTHLIEVRAIDAAGNIGPATAFRVTVTPK